MIHPWVLYKSTQERHVAAPAALASGASRLGVCARDREGRLQWHETDTVDLQSCAHGWQIQASAGAGASPTEQARSAHAETLGMKSA